MTRYGEAIHQIQHRIWAFQQALVYCISELLEKVCCHELNFYQQFHFLLRFRFFGQNSKLKYLY